MAVARSRLAVGLVLIGVFPQLGVEKITEGPPPAQRAVEQLRQLEEGESAQGNVLNFDDPIPPGAQNQERTPAGVHINGFISGRTGLSIDQNKNEVSDSSARLNVAFSKTHGRAGFYGAFSLYYLSRAYDNRVDQNFNDQARAQLETLYDTDTDPFQTEVHQVYIDFFTKYADWRIGRQLIKWGASDAPTMDLNPNAMISPTNQKDGLASDFNEAIEPVNAIKGNFYLGKFDLETVVIPLYQVTEYAAPNSFWGTPVNNRFTLPKTNVPLEGVVDDADGSDKITVPRSRLRVPLNRITINHKIPGPHPKNISGGLAIKRNVLKQDLSLYYFHGQERTPLGVTRTRIRGYLDTANRTFAISNVNSAYIRLKYPNTDAVGFAASGELWRLTYRFDINYSLQREFLLDDYNGDEAIPMDVPDFDDAVYEGVWDVIVRQRTKFMDQLAYAAGLSMDVTSILTLWFDYYGKQILGYRAEVIAAPRQDIVAPRFQLSFLRQTLLMSVQNLVVLQTLDTLIRPEVEYRLTNNAQFFVGSYFLLGKKRRALSTREINFGPIVNKDAIYTMARHLF